MGSTHNEEYLISDLRVLTLPEATWLAVACEPTPFARLGEVFEPMMGDLDRAQEAAAIYPAGAIFVRYYPVGEQTENQRYIMEVGVKAPAGTEAAAPAQLLEVPEQRCGGLLLWGGLEHIMEAYEALNRAVDAAGLERTGEYREIHYYFEGDASPRSVFGLFAAVR